MDTFLFLYPIREYFLVWASRFGLEISEGRIDPSKLGAIIDERYRKGGYRVIWVMFRGENGPDLDHLSEHVTIRARDLVIAADVTFKEMLRRRYPDPAFILSQLPSPVGRLVIGGFHMWDCVDKLAAFAHQIGFNVIVDEDTTELFFSSLSEIPLVRNRSCLADYLREPYLEMAKQARAGEPWLVQE